MEALLCRLALLISHFPIDSSPAFFTFSNFLGDRLWPMGAPNCWGPLVFELTLTNERYATVLYHDNYFKYFMFGKYNGFVIKARVSARMYFLVTFLILYAQTNVNYLVLPIFYKSSHINIG